MTKKHVLNIAGVATAVILGTVALQLHTPSDGLYPDSNLTPGKVDTTSFADLTRTYKGKTYSQSHRNVTDATKKKACEEYPSNCNMPNEKDHFIPLALGGSNDISNIWPEPEHVIVKGVDYGYHTKDQLEMFMVANMKNGNISVSDAQSCFKNDWVACYTKYIHVGVSPKGFE